MKKIIVLLALHISSVCLFAQGSDKKDVVDIDAKERSAFSGKTLTIQSADGLNITGDLYETGDTQSPVILLFHQAGYSRGEYRQIAPRLNELGFTCLAIDQRSGNAINGVQNETVLQAQQKGMKTDYADALPDLRAAMDYVLKNYKNRKIILWGSSYSSSLVFILANQYKNDVCAILSFSPGEYFKYDGQEISYYAKTTECPVFITSAGNEFELCDPIYKAIPAKEKRFFFPDFNGKHGSKALWKENEGSDVYWTEVIKFLETLKK